jgi:hypothetical protein
VHDALPCCLVLWQIEIRHPLPNPRSSTYPSYCLPNIPHSETIPPLRSKPIFLTHEMAGQSGPGRFDARFESALQAYRKTTGVTLADYSVAAQLQNCDSVEAITTLLLHHARAFGNFPGFDRIAKAIRNTISILSTLSATVSLGDAIGLVCQKTLLLVPKRRPLFTAFLTFEGNTGWPCYPTCCMCLSLGHIWLPV